jgi:hypothetical protein
LESALASSKRAKPALTAAAGPATSKPTSAAETKKVQTARLKAIFDRLKKECKSECARQSHFGRPVVYRACAQ